MAQSISIGDTLDGGNWSPAHVAIVLFMGLAVVFDSFESALLGIIVPKIAASLQIPLAHLATIFAMGLIGMIVGTIGGGLAGDRIGRRLTVIGSIALFLFQTMLVAAAQDLIALSAFRFATGLGALLPNVSAMVAEFSPWQHRSCGRNDDDDVYRHRIDTRSALVVRSFLKSWVGGYCSC